MEVGMEERRSGDRKRVMVTTLVRKRKDNDEVEIMEFRSRDLCIGGIFVSTEDLSLFQLGEELEILIDDDGRKYYRAGPGGALARASKQGSWPTAASA
jgi:hypothetical protein